MLRTRFGSTVLAFLACVSLLPPVRGQEPEPAKAAEPAAADKDKEKAPPAPPREQTIYIPYAKLREVFEKEGRGVFVPYEKFQELWRAAREKQVVPKPDRPPVDALIAEAENEATVEKEVVRVSAKLKIELVAEGWVELPLRLSDAVILSAKIGDAPARIVAQANGGYKLLLENPDKKPRQIELALEYAKAFTKGPGRNSVSFEAPQAPVNRWRIRVPESGVKVNIEPLIAASEVPTGDKKDDKQDEKKPAETVLLAFVGAAPTVKIDWTPKAEGASGLEVLASVESQQEVIVDEGLVRTRAHLVYAISRAELNQLVLEVPADQKIVNLFDANIRQWSVEKGETVQKVTAQLFEPARDTQRVTIELEKFTGDAAKAALSVPAIKAVGAARQQGIVVVHVADSLRVDAAKRTGLMQLDPSELPKNLAGKWELAFRYAALPFDLTLDVVKVKPRITVDELVETYFESESITASLLALYTIERAGVFELSLDVPAGYEVRQVRGLAAAGAAAAVIDSRHLEGENKTRLVVALSQKALGKVGLHVEMFKRLTDANLLTPTGKTSDVTVPLIRVVPDSVERTAGRLVVYAPESLRTTPNKTTGLRAISFSEAFEGLESTRGQRFPQLRPVLAFAFTKEAVDLSLTVERRKPQITVGQLLVARVDAGVVKFTATFNYDIRYSGVKSLRIDVPSALAPDVRNQTSSIPDKVITPPPPDVDEGYVAWQFTGEAELLGNVTIQLTWEKKLESLAIGKSVELSLPHLKPRDVARAWGQVVLVKAETIDVQAKGEPAGLRPIDPQHDLMPGSSVPDAALAFEFHDDWKLDVTATRYQLETVKRTSIERAVARMVVTRSKQVAVQALYRVRSARQRLAVELPEKVEFDTEPLRINGTPISLERGDKNQYFVPLVGRNADEPFVLELRYTVEGDASHLELPHFPEDPAVQKVYACVYLPEEQALLGSHGPWTEEIYWSTRDFLRVTPHPKRTDAELVAWVAENISCNTDLFQSFQTDGRQYVFSTLRPEPGPKGELSLTTFDEDWLHGLVFVVIPVLGLLLLARPSSNRLVGLGLLIALVVLAGVFLPTFARQALDGAFWLAVAIVLVMWFVKFLITWRPFPRREPAAVASTAGESPPPAEAATNLNVDQPTQPESPESGGPSHG